MIEKNMARVKEEEENRLKIAFTPHTATNFYAMLRHRCAANRITGMKRDGFIG